MSKRSSDRRTIRVVALAALLVTALTASACGGPGDARSAVEAGGKGSERSGVAHAGAKIETLDGREFDLAEKRGEVVAVFFMAGWCGNCIPEAQA